MSIKQLWAPWRMAYLGGAEGKGCFLCRACRSDRDQENLILYRGKKAFIIMNKYPYNSGHLMVAPKSHRGDLLALSDAELKELWLLTRHAVWALKKTYHPDAFNVGMNLGHAAGAGVKDHLHQHIVPRWRGDTNFLPVLDDAKSMPQYLNETYDQLYRYFRRL